MDVIDYEKILENILSGELLDASPALDNAFYARFGMSAEDVAEMFRTGDVLL